jgi:hypothetical protein
MYLNKYIGVITMKVKSITRYENPAYPVKNYISSVNAFMNLKPNRWMRNASIGVALSTIISLTNSACSQKTEGSDFGEAKKYLTAPIFEHGNGRGGFGCVSVAPPAFLSEEEALQVIQEEAKKQGVDFIATDKELAGIKLPATSLDLQYDEEGNLKKPLRTREGILKLDGLDSEKAIAFEFVSKDDVKTWSENEGNSTFESYDMFNTAISLEKDLEKEDEKITIGVFYDPVSYFTKKGFSEEAEKIMKNKEGKFEDIEKQFKELSIKDLREQVKDFLKWLKAEEII